MFTFVNEHAIKIDGYNHWVLDLQGSELLALKGAKNSLQYCNSLTIEVSRGEVYKNSAQYEDIINFLNVYIHSVHSTIFQTFLTQAHLGCVSNSPKLIDIHLESKIVQLGSLGKHRSFIIP